jgi:hypothetical protein
MAQSIGLNFGAQATEAIQEINRSFPGKLIFASRPMNVAHRLDDHRKFA